MECDKKKENKKYKNLVQQLPNGYENEYHRLLQYGMMVIICLHFARRGGEGISYTLQWSEGFQ
jgi:hypothetical protein